MAEVYRNSDFQPGMDVAEACADALLTACAHVLVLQNAMIGLTDDIGLSEARGLALFAIDTIIRRTATEGPKPR